MAITKIQSESLNLADTYDFTGSVTGAGESNASCFLATGGNSNQTVTNNAYTKVEYNQEIFDTALKIFLTVFRRNQPQFLYQVLNPFMQGNTTIEHEEYLVRLLRGIARVPGGFPLQKPNYNILPENTKEG